MSPAAGKSQSAFGGKRGFPDSRPVRFSVMVVSAIFASLQILLLELRVAEKRSRPLEADTRASLRKRALGSPGGQSDFFLRYVDFSEAWGGYFPDGKSHGTLVLERSRLWRRVLDFGKRSEVRGFGFCMGLADKRPDFLNGGLHLPLTGDGLYRFEHPRIFSACIAVFLVGAGDG